jgi:hypothetical protein
VFSGVDQTSRIDTFALACTNLNRDIRGLCAGDVNGTYMPPNGYKMATPGLELVNRGTLPVTNEIMFPVRLVGTTHAVETTHALSLQQPISAITLMLDYNPTLIEITGVEMPENGGTEPWFEVRGSRFKVRGSRFEVQGWGNREPSSCNLKPAICNLEP